MKRMWKKLVAMTAVVVAVCGNAMAALSTNITAAADTLGTDATEAVNLMISKQTLILTLAIGIVVAFAIFGIVARSMSRK